MTQPVSSPDTNPDRVTRPSAAEPSAGHALQGPADNGDQPSNPLPTWARIADGLAGLLLVLGIGLLIGGRVRMTLGPVRLSMGSAGRLFMGAVALLVIRHWRHREPPIYDRVRAAWHRFRSDAPLKRLTASYWGIRLSCLLVGYFATTIIGFGAGKPFRVSANEFMNLPARFDSGWYLQVAVYGYMYTPSGGQQNLAFLPAFPVLMRVAGTFLGADQDQMRAVPLGPDQGRVLWGGLLLSLLMGWIASIWLFRLARRWMDTERAQTAVLLLQAYPFALFMGAAYTESLYLLTSVAALTLFLEGSWLSSMALGLVAGLSRPNGFIVSVPLGLLLLVRLWNGRSDRRMNWKHLGGPVVAALAPVLGTLTFCALVYSITGDPFKWARLHAAWGREYRSVFGLVGDYYDYISDVGVYGYTAGSSTDPLNLAAIFALAAVVPVWRRLGAPYAALVLATVLPPLTMGGVMSMGRITSTVFPLFLWMGLALSPGAQRAIVMSFLVVQGLTSALFFTWRPLY